MVLTNFECWALGSNQSSGQNEQFEDRLTTRSSVDLFNPRLVLETCGTSTSTDADATAKTTVSHISSNGYYGFSYINANVNCVNDVTVGGSLNSPRFIDNEMTVDIDLDEGRCATATNINLNSNNNNNNNKVMPTASRKKRSFADTDEDVLVQTKKCCFDNNHDNNDVEAQYCNDFFRMSSQQIGTQSCLMETEDYHQQNIDTIQSANSMVRTTTHISSASHLEQVDALAVSASPSNDINTFHKSNSSSQFQLQSQGDDASISVQPLRLHPANRGKIELPNKINPISEGNFGDSSDHCYSSYVQKSGKFFAANITAINNENSVSYYGLLPEQQQKKLNEPQQQSTNEEKRPNTTKINVDCCPLTSKISSKINKSKVNQQQVMNISKQNNNYDMHNIFPTNDWQLLSSSNQNSNRFKVNNIESKKSIMIETLSHVESNDDELSHVPFSHHSAQQSLISLESMFSTIHGGGYDHLRRHMNSDANGENFCEEI